MTPTCFIYISIYLFIYLSIYSFFSLCVDIAKANYTVATVSKRNIYYNFSFCFNNHYCLSKSRVVTLSEIIEDFVFVLQVVYGVCVILIADATANISRKEQVHLKKECETEVL